MSSEKLQLRPFQKISSKFVQKHPRCILRLDTGLGKTCVCIDAAKELKCSKVLVIAPAFLKKNWLREIEMWNGREYGARWKVISYTKLSDENHLRKVQSVKWDLIICDEAHYLKNWTAKRTVNIVKHLLPKCRRVILSTATPYVRSASDYHPLFSTCEPGKWGSASSFYERYCLKKPDRFSPWKKWVYYGTDPAHALELNKAFKRFSIQFKKSEVEEQLPDKLVTDLTLENIPEDYLLDNLDTEEYIDIDTGRIRGGLREILSKTMVDLGLLKVTRAMEFIHNIDPKVNPTVIFCKHHDVVQKLMEELNPADGVRVAKLTGKMTALNRQNVVDDFQNGKIDILIATMGASGVGLNITRANIAVFIELPWSYTELKQCEDRLHRIGQKHCVNIYRFIAERTVDELVINVLNNKISGEDMTIGSM